MSKTRKIFVITFLVLGSGLISISFFAKIEHWTNGIYCYFALGGLILATSALVLTVRKPRV